MLKPNVPSANTSTRETPDYPILWRPVCKKYRIIRCKDDIQYIVQQFKQPTWRSDSYHVEWESIGLRHGEKEALNTLSESIETCSESGNGSR